MTRSKKKPIIFVCYSHKDKSWLEYLHSHLAPAIEHGALDIWDDRKVRGGEDWQQHIRNKLDECAVCIILVSRHALSSKFILGVEMKRMLQRRRQEGAHIYPIVVSPCFNRPAKWLMALNLRPVDGKALSKFRSSDRDVQMASIVGEIVDIVASSAKADPNTLRKTSSSSPGRSPKRKIIGVIQFGELANQDCARFHISTHSVAMHLEQEVVSHPEIFEAPFSSLPLLFDRFVMLVGWDGNSTVRIERVMERSEAYASHDHWAACLGRYRTATTLAYRSEGGNALVLPRNSERTIRVYKDLIDYICRYRPKDSISVSLKALLDEATESLERNDLRTCIIRFEAILSTVHKLLLYETPGNAGTSACSSMDSPIGITKPRESTVGRILIVDDDSWMLRQVSRLLEKETSFDIQATNDPVEALKIVVNNPIDVVVLDMNMPKIDGLAIANIIRDANLSTRIVIMTGYTSIPITVAAIKLGIVEDYLSKPFSADDLISAVRKAIHNLKIQHGDDQSLATLRANFASLTVREHKIMELVVTGHLNKVIATKMALSERSIKSHRAKIMRHMGAESLADLVQMAQALGIKGPTSHD
jgi:FixJ family two-component response regulator